MIDKQFEKEEFKKSVKENVKFLYRKTLEEATQEQIFQAVSYTVKDVIIDNWLKSQKAYEKQDPKIVYYMSMEFLMGRALGNNLINLGAYGEVKEALEELGLDINCIEDQEPDPALGNGGLGRLAACFLDSLATLNYCAYGCGIRYRYGMFKQEIRDGYQVEAPDNWLKNGYPFELRRPEYAKEVHFGGYVRVEWDPVKNENKFIHEGYQAVKAVPYDMPITGYNNDVVNTLRIWDAEPIVDFNLDSFDKGDYHNAVEQENLARTIVEVLYPNDNHMAGKELRLKQQYFFVSASLQAAIAKYKKTHDDITKLHEKVVFQMNDTHPTVAVAELMRILIDEEGLGWDQAWDITTKCCAYTNHTIMSEALEKWPIELFSRLLPRVYQIIEEINRRFILEIQAKYPGNYEKIKKMAIIYDGQVKMANLAQMVNVLQSVILTEGPKMIKTPTYHVFHMYRHHQGATLLNSTLTGVGETGIGEWKVPEVTESVSEDAEHIITVTLNNLSADEEKEIEIVIAGDEHVYSVKEAKVVSAEMHAHNTFDAPELVKEEEFTAYKKCADGIKVMLPPCSVVELRLQ
mgnify:CR=1 FL=1